MGRARRFEDGVRLLSIPPHKRPPEKREWFGIEPARKAFERGECTCSIEDRYFEANVDPLDRPIEVYQSHAARCPVHGGKK